MVHVRGNSKFIYKVIIVQYTAILLLVVFA